MIPECVLELTPTLRLLASCFSLRHLSPTDNPTLSYSERQVALDKVVPKSSSPFLSNLLSVLSENGRLSQADRVFADFNTLMAAYRGELEVVVTSAEPLDSKTMNRLEKALKGSALADGKTLKFTNKVNPSVLGGLLVDIGDKTIDATAATRVNRYNSALARELVWRRVARQEHELTFAVGV